MAQNQGKSDGKSGSGSKPRSEGLSAAGQLAAVFKRALLRRQDAEAGEDRARDAAAKSATKRADASKATKVVPKVAPRRARARTAGASGAEQPAKPAKVHPVSPLAPERQPTLAPIAGMGLGAGEAGIRYKGRTDLMIASFEPGTTVAGVFTTSRMPGAPVEWCRTNLAEGRGGARLLVVNAGNANVFTGRAGVAAVERTAAAGAALAGCRKREVFLCSTGVIGEPLPVERIEAALPRVWSERAGDSAAWAAAARAIMTTDTFPKAATRTTEIGGVSVHINGIAKGSGMIAPDLATMLCFLATDAAVPADVLQTLLVLGVRDSFNATTVDSDTSTSDTVLLFATGRGAKHEPITRAGDPRLRQFRLALQEVLEDLAKQVVRDGEGATKFVTVDVSGAESAKAARTIALSIANSPLVKTALAGGDANWGRIVMAVGKSGERADRDRLVIRMGGLPVAEKGARSPAYDEARLTAAMAKPEIRIEVDVGLEGPGRARIWTCDLTHGYIDINGSYRS